MKKGTLLSTITIPALAVLFTWLTISAQAAPALVSVVPANGTSGVAVSTPFVFTFSEQMDAELTTVMFLDIANPFGSIETTDSWNPGFTVLTCTPVTGFPVNKTLYWSVDATSFLGEMIDPSPFGSFSTSGGGGNTGSGTNQYTSFAVGKMHYYHQTNDVVALDDEVPYSFLASTSLASNRTATVISVKLPTGVTTNLSNSFSGAPEDYLFFDFQMNLTSFDTAYPAGDYTFSISSTPASTPVKVTLPAAMQQPNAPKVSNWTALQSANPTQAVTISWSSFQGGTAADYIKVQVGNVFETPDPGATNALNGTQTSVMVPAGMLQNNADYTSSIIFYRANIVTNQATKEVTEPFLATSTEFTIHTSTGGGSTGEPVQFAAPTISSGQFTCEITCSPGQTFTIESSPTLLQGSWVPLLTTNAVGNKVRFIDSRPFGERQYYRARNGL